MDFYAAQEEARRSTTRLVVLFGLAVISLVALTNLLVMFVFGYMGSSESVTAPSLLAQFNWPVFILVGVAVLLLVLGGSGYKILSLAGSGEKVAESLGGAPIDPSTTDPAERRALNVVEEMAIASGMPVPPVYLLKGEAGINAFAAGSSPADAVVGLTRGTIERLTRDELQGVVGHEFSHILNGDMRLNIRLIGVLHGILLIGMLGQFALRSMGMRRGFSSSRGNNRDNGVAAILILGVGLLVIGYAGTFFGNLIKASVSRKREFLADASAVQFTRDPAGIAGALKKIGGFSAGSKLQSPNAPSMSHAYFSEGVSFFFQSLFATHPPLEVRIRRLDPNWDGGFVAAGASPIAEETAGAAGFSSLAGDTEGAAAQSHGSRRGDGRAANALVHQVGRAGPEHLEYAAGLIAAIPTALREAAREPYGARALIYGLLLDRQSRVREAQLAHLEREGDFGVDALTRQLHPALAGLDVAVRLPLVDLTLPTLRELSRPQYARFMQNLDALIRMDAKVNLFEWALRQILRHHLEPHFTERAPKSPRYGRYAAVSGPIRVLFSMLVYACVRDEADRESAFDAAMQTLGLAQVTLLPPREMRPDGLDQAVDALARLKPLMKPALLKAALACITRDQEYSPDEIELMRAISDTLDCPMPVYLGGS